MPKHVHYPFPLLGWLIDKCVGPKKTPYWIPPEDGDHWRGYETPKKKAGKIAGSDSKALKIKKT